MVAGKGGVGKSATSALLARAFAAMGFNVLALDLDSNPGLAISLGVPPDDNPVPPDVIEEAPDAAYGWALSSAYGAGDVVDRCGVDVSPRIRFLSFGNITQARNNLRRFVPASWQVLRDFQRDGWVTVVDLEAGPTTPFEGIARTASIVLILVEATPASILAARRIASILEHEETDFVAVVSKGVRDSDVDRVAEDLGPPFAVIPWDANIRRAEKEGSLVDLHEEAPAMQSVKDLACLIERRVLLRETVG